LLGTADTHVCFELIVMLNSKRDCADIQSTKQSHRVMQCNVPTRIW